MIEGNPFEMVYSALWDLFESSSLLTSLVRTKNRIKFDHTRPHNPIKEEVSNADLPEVMLVSTATGGNIRDTSSTSRINRRYEWVISSGDASMVNKWLPVEWALWAVMADYPRVLHALRWPENATDSFCKVTRLQDVNSGLTNPEQNRGLVGWSSIWAIEVEMHFAFNDLILAGQPDTGSGTGSGSGS